MNIYITNILVTFFSIFFSFNSYGGFFDKTICFETDTKLIDGIIYLSNENKPFTGNNLCKHSNGKNKSKGSFRDGKKHDIWIEWKENSELSYESEYKKNRLIRLKKYQNRELLAVTNYSYFDKSTALSELEDQESRYGQKECVTNYDGNNNKDGLTTCWYLNGQKRLKLSFKDNVPSGMHTYWYDDGVIWSETFY